LDDEEAVEVICDAVVVAVLIGAVVGSGAVAPGSSRAVAATIGSNLAGPSSGSVCAFQSLEPETRVCTVGQRELQPGHTAPAGLVAPFDGVIVRWSVLSGTAPPGTGAIKLALRLTDIASHPEKGPEVELPPSPPGTLHTFGERMPVSAGQPIGVKIAISNRSTEEAGAPIALREKGVGTIDTSTGEPWAAGTIWDTEEDVELLLNAEIEPDADHDGYGDLTQDCFPNEAAYNDCGIDLYAPRIRPRFAARQAFLRTGVILVRLASNEAATVRALGLLEIQGRGGRTYGLRAGRSPVAAGGQATLRLRVRKRALKAAKAAYRDGRMILVTVSVAAIDAAGNERLAAARVRPR
jgi:hypothetical protein